MLMLYVAIVCCADVEEMSDSLVSQLAADITRPDEVGDADNQSTGSITLSVAEHRSLTLRLSAAEDAAVHASRQLQHALSDLDKMRLFFFFIGAYYTVVHKKGATLFFAVTSSDVYQFKKIFYRWKSNEISRKFESCFPTHHKYVAALPWES